MSRFDTINTMPNINFYEINNSKVYIDVMHKPRKIFPDNFIIMPQEVCIKWFDIYDKINEIIENKELDKLVRSYNETVGINAEELLFSKYLLEFKNLDNILFFR